MMLCLDCQAKSRIKQAVQPRMVERQKIFRGENAKENAERFVEYLHRRANVFGIREIQTIKRHESNSIYKVVYHERIAPKAEGHNE